MVPLRFVIFALVGLVLIGCARTSPTPTPSPTPVVQVIRETVVVTRVVTRVVTPTPTSAPATPVPDRVVLCAGQEPTSLDPLVDGSDTARLVQTLVMGRVVGPAPDGTLTSDLFTRVPSLENGDARLMGEEGPDGQLEVTFRLRANLRWEDGTPVRAGDFVTAWQWARQGWGQPDVQARAAEIEDIRVLDDRTFTVVLRQGLMTPLYATYAFAPYPTHLLAGAEDPEARLRALGRAWPAIGPYRLVEWRSGKEMVLSANPTYTGGERGAPRVSTFMVRFLPQPDAALVALLSGECDVLAPGVVGPDAYPILEVAKQQNIVEVQVINGPAWEHLDFNTWPADGRPPLFADARVRQAIALALDRTQLAQEVTLGLAQPMQSWLPSDHWAFQSLPLLAPGANDPRQANRLLEEAGWRDEDGDGVREAHGVQGTFWDGTPWQIADGTPLEATLVAPTGNALHAQTAQAIRDALAQIGIDVQIALLPPADLFGPEGVLRRRTFDLALFAWVPDWEAGGRYLWVGNAICRRANGTLYAAQAGYQCEPGDETLYPAQIPSAENGWQGGNMAGWANPEASLAIYQATAHLEQEERRSFYASHQMLFNQDLPVLPLYQYPQVIAWRKGLTGIVPAPYTPLTWNAATWSW